MSSTWNAPAMAGLVFVAVVVMLSGPGGLSSAAFAGHSGVPSAAPHSATNAHMGAVIPAVPRPLITCPPLYPLYAKVGGDWPLVPAQIHQAPCPYLAQDEVHGSLFSNAPHSAENFRVPIYLPGQGPAGQQNSFHSVYVGDILSGDTQSSGNQSFAQTIFTPLPGGGNLLNYSVTVALWSMVNASFFPGHGCPASAINFSWQNAYWCEVNEMGGGNGASFGTVSSAHWYNVTYDGVKGGTRGTHLWLNNSTTNFVDHVFNATMDNGGGSGIVGSFTFAPAYNQSCPLNCVLNWSMPLGIGVGLNVCPLAFSVWAACDTYNQSAWIVDPPIQFGSPEFFANGTYSGDYRYLAPSSASGVCNPVAPIGVVTFCANYNSNGGTGYYPIFTFNGTWLNFGTNYSWTTENFGGSSFQYGVLGQPVLLTPFWVDQVLNNSLAGYLAPNLPLNVSARLQDMGSATSATLHYRVAGGSWAPVAMSRTSGTPTLGVYSANVPSGPDGLIDFNVSGVNSADAMVTSLLYHVIRGPLPHFNLTLLSSAPPSCGRVWFNGTPYVSGSTVVTLPGTFPIKSVGCYPYVFDHWNATPGVYPIPITQPIANVTVSASGSLEQVLTYVRPHDSIRVFTNPAACGSVNLNGTAHVNGDLVSLFDAIGVPLTVNSACSLDGSFAGWNFTGNFTILGGTFTPFGNGSLTANFVPSGSADSVIFYTSPTSCGGVLFRGAGYTNGMSVNVLPGAYSLGALACPHFGFRNFSSSGSIATNNSSVTVNGGGWVRATDYHLTEIRVATDPASCGRVTVDGLSYSNGSVVVVANNSTHTIGETPCQGYSFFGWNTSGGLHVFGNITVANGSGTLLAVFVPGQQTSFVAFLTDPSFCGTIQFEGISFHNTNYTKVAPGTVATVSATACPNYGFVRWLTTGGITIAGNTAYLNGTGGSIEAVFRPVVEVFLFTSPMGCGSVSLGGTVFTNNGTAFVPTDSPYTLIATPCAHYYLSQWLNSTSALISGNLVFFTGPAILTAQFAQSRYAIQVTTDPPNCGAVKIGGQQLSNGTTIGLYFGAYAIAPVLCLGDHLQSWVVNGNVSIAGSLLTVNGSGKILGLYRPVPPAVVLTVPDSSFAGQAVGLLATVAVLVPPFNYTYDWTFGDGGTLVTPANFTSHTYASTGTYTVSVKVTDPYHRTATQNSTISIVSGGALKTAGIPTWSILVGLGIIAVVAVLALVGWAVARRRPTTTVEETTLAMPPPSDTPSLEEESMPRLSAPPPDSGTGPEP